MDNFSAARPMEDIIETLDTLIADMNARTTKTRMTAILITELQKAVALAREVVRIEGHS